MSYNILTSSITTAICYFDVKSFWGNYFSPFQENVKHYICYIIIQKVNLYIIHSTRFGMLIPSYLLQCLFMDKKHNAYSRFLSKIKVLWGGIKVVLTMLVPSKKIFSHKNRCRLFNDFDSDNCCYFYSIWTQMIFIEPATELELQNQAFKEH